MSQSELSIALRFTCTQLKLTAYIRSNARGSQGKPKFTNENWHQVSLLRIENLKLSRPLV